MAKSTSSKPTGTRVPPGKGFSAAPRGAKGRGHALSGRDGGGKTAKLSTDKPKARPNMDGAKGRGQDVTRRNADLVINRIKDPANTMNGARETYSRETAYKAAEKLGRDVGKSQDKGTYTYDPKKKK